MKDKRQRMALVWPYAMYGNPALAATLLAYHHHPGFANPGLGHAFYASRFSPYETPVAPYPTHSHNFLPPNSASLARLHGLGIPQTPTVFQPILPHQSCSPSQSDASSDCESTPNPLTTISPIFESVAREVSDTEIKKEVEVSCKRSPSPNFQFPQNLVYTATNFRPDDLQSIQGTWENKKATLPSSSAGQPKTTKLFQPYKNDVPGRVEV